MSALTLATWAGLRGFIAAATLKVHDRVDGRRHSAGLRGFTAAASLKGLHRALKRLPVRGLRGFSAAAMLKVVVRSEYCVLRLMISEA